MNDFKKEYKFLSRKIDLAIKDCLKSGWYILGKNVAKFEAEFAEYTGTKYCIGVGNGLEALQIALLAFGVKPGDEVITVSNSAVATALAITAVGAKPVFVDVDEYYHMDAKLIEMAITKKTRAILPVHLFGQIVDINSLKKIAKKYNLALIEDCAQAHGAEFKGKKAGTFGDLGCFSFYPTKNLGGYGDGGAITTNSKSLYEKCQMLRNYGQKNRYRHEIKGLNSRLDELQAAILRVKLPYLKTWVKKRNQLAQLYIKNLKSIPEVKVPLIRGESFHAFHLFVIQVENRLKLQEFLKKNGVESIIHYPIPIHKQRCYLEFNSLELKKTELFSKKILSLTISPFLTEPEINNICRLIKDFYRK